MPVRPLCCHAMYSVLRRACGVIWSMQDGRTALHLAIEHGVATSDLQMARLLLCYGADANIRDEVRHAAFTYIHIHAYTHTHLFNGPLSGTTRVSRYQKGETSLDFTEARYSEWQWHQLGHMQVCTSLQIDNHASTLPLKFLQAGCPSCRPTNSVKALKAHTYIHTNL